MKGILCGRFDKPRWRRRPIFHAADIPVSHPGVFCRNVFSRSMRGLLSRLEKYKLAQAIDEKTGRISLTSLSPGSSAAAFGIPATAEMDRDDCGRRFRSIFHGQIRLPKGSTEGRSFRPERDRLDTTFPRSGGRDFLSGDIIRSSTGSGARSSRTARSRGFRRGKTGYLLSSSCCRD